jgi:hypothetical protein
VTYLSTGNQLTEATADKREKGPYYKRFSSKLTARAVPRLFNLSKLSSFVIVPLFNLALLTSLVLFDLSLSVVVSALFCVRQV